MNGIFWLFVVAMTGCLTGILLGEKGYGIVLSMGCVRGLDILFAVAGAIVAICRQVSEWFFRSPSDRGMSGVALIEWHDNLTVKELAPWKARREQ